jgi:hypothetical protein
MTTTKEIYDKDTLQKIRFALPFGGMKKLHERTGYSTGFLSRFFQGHANINEKNQIIISEANKLIRDYMDNTEKTKEEIMKCLIRNSNPTKLYTDGTN